MTMTTTMLKIDFPMASFVKSNRGIVLVARGTADRKVVAVTGQCKPKDPHGQTFEGTTFRYELVPSGGAASPRHHRWCMVFQPAPHRFVAGETYTLTVQGLDASASWVAPASIDFTVAKPPVVRLVTIEHPSINDAISDPDAFSPYGDLTPSQLVSGSPTMTLVPSGNVTLPIYIFQDPMDLQFWYADFPHLAATGTGKSYTLRVADTGGSSDTVTGLTV